MQRVDPGLDPSLGREAYKKDPKWNIKTMAYYPMTKGMEFPSNKETRAGISDACYCVKEANLRRLRTDSNRMTFWKRRNHNDSKKIGGCQGMGGWSTEEFCGQ